MNLWDDPGCAGPFRAFSSTRFARESGTERYLQSWRFPHVLASHWDSWPGHADSHSERKPLSGPARQSELEELSGLC